jgi:tRNA nucleotidyltransferase (CCA-adding enzyme)
MKINSRINRLIKVIARQSQRLGINAYLVGGPVRDLLLGESNIDLDIAVDKDIEKFIPVLAKFFACRYTFHPQFKSATLFLDGLNIDLAMTREEIYRFRAALPEVRVSSLEKDLFRRDFTINAMAMRIGGAGLGRLIDPYNGLPDLKNKKIRILHKKSFLDDPTRIIRAVRFEQRLGFNIEKETFSLLKEAIQRKMLSRLSPARIGNEVIKLLREKQPWEYIKRLKSLCGLDFIHPAIKFNPQRQALFLRINQQISGMRKPVWGDFEPWVVYFIALTEDLDRRELIQVVRDYELGRLLREHLLHAHYLRRTASSPDIFRDKPSEIFLRIRPIYPEAVIYLIARLNDTRLRNKLFDFWDRFVKAKPSIKGEDLKKMGFIPGPIFNKILEAVFLAKLDGRVGNLRGEREFVSLKFGHRPRIK